MGSETSSCLRYAGKLGTTKATKKRRSTDPGKIWIISLAMTVENKVIMLETITANSSQYQRVSKGIHEDETG